LARKVAGREQGESPLTDCMTVFPFDFLWFGRSRGMASGRLVMTIGPQLAVTEGGETASTRAISALAGQVFSAAHRGGTAAAAGLAWRSG
jgi:hypothetical protein